MPVISLFNLQRIYMRDFIFAHVQRKKVKQRVNQNIINRMARMIGFTRRRDFPKGEIRAFKTETEREKKKEAKREREKVARKRLACLTPRHASGVACNKL